MERYVFFNTHSATVIHYRDYEGTSDIMRLAMDSYTLLQITDFNLKSICKEKIICFAKDPNFPLALTIEFSKDSTTEEDGHQLAASILQLFMQQFGHILTGSYTANSFKSFKKSLHIIANHYIEPIMEKIADETKSEFIYILFLKQDRSTDQNSKEKNLFMSAGSSINTEISAIEKATRSSGLKRKYPFIIENNLNISSPRQLFYRLYSKNTNINSEIINIINTSATLGNELLEFERDELQSMNFCFGRSEIQILKYEEMILVISTATHSSLDCQIKQLYSWARLLIM